MVSRRAAARLEDRIASLGELSRHELVERWQAHFKAPPPKGIRRPLLMRALAYRLQAKRWGGLRPQLAQQLRKLATETAADKVVRPEKSGFNLKPGTRLYREWNSKTHVVEVTEKGVFWNGQHYRSLSAVARAITGARWSGPRFFGLKGTRPS
jgi:hypothetical protein